MKTFFLGASLAIVSLLFAPSVQAMSEAKPWRQTHHLLPITHFAHDRAIRAVPPLPPRYDRRMMIRVLSGG